MLPYTGKRQNKKFRPEADFLFLLVGEISPSSIDRRSHLRRRSCASCNSAMIIPTICSRHGYPRISDSWGCIAKSLKYKRIMTAAHWEQKKTPQSQWLRDFCCFGTPEGTRTPTLAEWNLNPSCIPISPRAHIFTFNFSLPIVTHEPH